MYGWYKVASHTNIWPVERCMEVLTHRDYLDILTYLEMEYDIPSRDNYYQMMIGCEIRRVLAEHPNQIGIKDFYLSFQPKRKKPLTEEQRKRRIQLAKERVICMVGGRDKMIQKVITPNRK